MGWEDVLRKEGMIAMSSRRSGGGAEGRGGRSRRRREDGEEWYITSKLVQLEDDQIASRVINRSAVLPCESQTDTIAISSLSTTLCSVTSKNAADVRADAFEEK